MMTSAAAGSRRLFQLICSYVLWPFAFLMGVAQEDCRQVAELIGIKTFVNEMVAYTELGTKTTSV